MVVDLVLWRSQIAAAAATKSLQSCPTLCDPIDGSPPGSTVPGILQARTLEWVAISISNAWKWKVKRKSLSRVRLLANPWTVAYQAPPSMGFSRQEYWSGVPLPPPNSDLWIRQRVQKEALGVTVTSAPGDPVMRKGWTPVLGAGERWWVATSFSASVEGFILACLPAFPSLSSSSPHSILSPSLPSFLLPSSKYENVNIHRDSKEEGGIHTQVT